MKSTLIIVLSISLFLACSIKTPGITLTGEKTALENQILGAYEDLTDNNVITTSKRVSTKGEDNRQSQVVRMALQRQQLNQDEIDELKKAQVIGENNKGYLQALDNEKYLQDANFRKMVDALVEDENHNRHIIYQRVLALNHKKSDSDETLTIFAKMQHEKTPPGTMIQLLNGSWVEKKAKAGK